MIKTHCNCIAFIFAVQLLTSCIAQKNCTNCGVVVRKTRGFDSVSKKYLPSPQSRDMKMWYKDSLIIQEVHHIYQNEDIYGNITWRVDVDKYKFVDMRRREVFEFYTFSDTSKVIRRCAKSDTACKRETWAFWIETQKIMPDGIYEEMPDTTINGIAYKRIRSFQNTESEKGKMRYFTLGYFRYNFQKAPLMFDKSFSKKIGLPLLRFDTYYEPAFYTPAYGEIEYLPRKLSNIELRVFEAWKRKIDSLYNEN